MIKRETLAHMRDDWNARAREDANFYVAFGRRGQDCEEFFETGGEVVKGLEWEMRRLRPVANPRALRALEIGCGPGRLMKPMSRRFGEIHGVDVSDEMVALASKNLRGVPHAHVHRTNGSNLAPFADESFDFVYSYAVFQHIPSRDVVFEYLREARRVLKPGGILRCQLNGLPPSAQRYDTWSGVRIAADEVRGFALDNDLQLLALEGTHTQYMWTTMRKGRPERGPARETRIRRITNAHSSEPVAPASGRFASVTIWIDNLPADCDLNGLEARIGGLSAVITYIGPQELDGLQQVNAMLPSGCRTGVLPIELSLRREPLCPPGKIRIIPAPAFIPRVLSVTDGINLLSGPRILSGSVKVILDESPEASRIQVFVAGQPVTNIEVFCADPLPQRYEVNFPVPAGIGPGKYLMELRLGARGFAPVELEVV